jgi:DNA-binding CsgD family transcriptional regulator
MTRSSSPLLNGNSALAHVSASLLFVYSHLFGEMHGVLADSGQGATVSGMLRSRVSKPSRSGSVPFGLRASRAVVGGEEVAVFSFLLPPPAFPRSLSAVERIVALALLEGMSNSEIALARQKSVRTVANQVASLFRKLGVRSRSEAVIALGRLQGS